ncbi:MAG: ATP-binding protein [Eubacteriales bacterium]|nr:ATP-binding protein [Eubacteriales bacterium]
MRIIPKRTKVRMELFKGIELMDVLVGSLGAGVAVSLLVSNLPGHLYLMVLVLLITVALIVPIDDDKGYQLLFHVLKYAARPRIFYKKRTLENKAAESTETQTEKDKDKDKGKEKKAKKKKAAVPGMLFTVEDITPFTEIDGDFIQYGKSYSAVVMRIPSVEFRFYNESRQNSLIDRCLASILRMAVQGETISMVKLDQPEIYDEFIENESRKLEELEEAYLNGLLTDEELTVRVGIIYDRIGQLEDLNFRNKVYRPVHYLMFCHKDRNLLETQLSEAINTFAANNIDCKKISGAELAIFLKYGYGMLFNEREAYQLNPDEYRDWIIPDCIRFTSRTVQFDDLITHNFRLRDYPTLVANAWGAQMFNEVGTKVVLKMTPIDRYKAIRQIDRSIDELREQESSTGKTSRLMEVGMHIETLSEVLRLLQGENETLFNVATYVTVNDYQLSEEIRRDPKVKLKNSAFAYKRKVRRDLAEDGFKVTDMMLQQFDAYGSTQLSGYDAFKQYARGIQSGSVAAAFPYVMCSLSDKNGVYVGEASGIPAFVNFFQRDRERVNSNMVIIGKSGSGKSYATKTILTQLAAENSKIFILDPENEYTKLAKNMHGKIIDVGSASQGRLNPFHIITTLSDEEGDDAGESEGATGFHTHLQFLEEFYRQILPGIDADALEYLNTMTIRMYEQKGIDETTDLSQLSASDYPIFDDLYEKIINDIQTSSGDYIKNNLKILLNYISKFAEGGRNAALWNGEASITTNENFIVFNFQSLLANKNNIIANGQMLLVLKWLDNEIIKNREYNMKYKANRKIVVVIDEAHVFIDSKYPIALDFMYQLAKRIRKYNGMQIVITQNIKDFVGTEELARKSTAIINASQYSFIFPLAPNDMEDLCKLYEKSGAINESEQDDIINNGRGRAFVITSPAQRTCVDIVAANGVEELFTM